MPALDRGMGNVPVAEIVEAINTIMDEDTRRRIVKALAEIAPYRYWTFDSRGNILASR